MKQLADGYWREGVSNFTVSGLASLRPRRDAAGDRHMAEALDGFEGEAGALLGHISGTVKFC